MQHSGRMKMTPVEIVDGIMIRAGEPVTIYALAGAMREMFNESMDLRTPVHALANEPLFVPTGFREYGLSHAGRMEGLVGVLHSNPPERMATTFGCAGCAVDALGWSRNLAWLATTCRSPGNTAR